MSSQSPINRSSESGAALLLYALFLALLGALGAYGYLAAERTMTQSNPQMILVNRAQAMAYVGVAAIQNWYNQQLPICSVSLATGGTCPIFSGALATASAQSTTLSGTQVSMTASTISNTLNGTTGSIIVNSTGLTGAVQQTMQAIMTTSLQTLNNTNANFYLNGSSTINGTVKNNTGQPVIVVGTTDQNASSDITFNGTNVQIEQLPVFPDINPQGLEQYASMTLTQVNGNPTITIPASAVSFYDAIFGVSLPSSGYSCTVTTSSSSSNGKGKGSSSSISTCGTLTGADVPSYSPSSGWTISSNLPGLIYSDGSVTVDGEGNNAQLTVAAEGTITTSGNGTIYNPFANTSSGLTNYCGEYPSLAICEPDTNPATPYPYLMGVTFVSAGDFTLGGNNETVNGDIATSSSFLLNGGGNKNFGGIILAKNGIGGGTTVNGSIALNQKIKGSNHATFGGIQVNITGTRWIAP